MADNDRIDTLLGYLLLYPEHHDQSHWYSGYDPDLGGTQLEQLTDEHCGTAACAGGWTDALFGLDRAAEGYSTEAALGLTTDQGDFVFYDTLRYADREGAAVRALKYIKDHPLAIHGDLCAHELSCGGRERTPEELGG